MLFVVVLDTSASMNQKTSSGLTLLDAAKAAVEHFIRVRQRDPTLARGDKYLLVTTGGDTAGDANLLQVGWKDPPGKFSEVLKTVQARGLTNIGAGLRVAFDTLHRSRMQQFEVDSYGQGRNPWFTPHAAVVWLLTDGGRLVDAHGVVQSLTLPESTAPGAELTNEPFRWDQKLFVTSLRMPGIATAPRVDDTPPCDVEPSLVALAELTGGAAAAFTTTRGMLVGVDRLVARCARASVVVDIQAPGLPPTTTTLHPRTNGVWPIPEAFWPGDMSTSGHGMPSRPAHPLIRLEWRNEPSSAQLDLFACDRYDLETNAFTQHCVQHLRDKPNQALHCIALCKRPNAPAATAANDVYGYIKATASSGGGPGSATLVLLPYNFPRMLRLVEEWHNGPKGLPSPQWRGELEGYMRFVPQYYLQPLRIVFRRLNIPFSDRLDVPIPPSIVSQLSQIRDKIVEQDEAQAVALAQSASAKASRDATRASSPQISPTGTLNGSEDAGSSNGLGDTAQALLYESDGSVQPLDLATDHSGAWLSGGTFAHLTPAKNAQGGSGASGSSMEGSGGGDGDNVAPNVLATSITSGVGPGTRNVFDIPLTLLPMQLQSMRATYFKTSRAASAGARSGRVSSAGGGGVGVGGGGGRGVKGRDSSGDSTITIGDDYLRHHIPISQMGNFAEIIRRTGPLLRDPYVDDEGASRLNQLGGNPWSRSRTKDAGEVVDGANEAMSIGSGGGGGGSGGRRKKRGRRRSSDGSTGGLSLTLGLGGPATNGGEAAGGDTERSTGGSGGSGSAMFASLASAHATPTRDLAGSPPARGIVAGISERTDAISNPWVTPIAAKLDLLRIVRGRLGANGGRGGVGAASEADCGTILAKVAALGLSPKRRESLMTELCAFAKSHRRQALATALESALRAMS